MSDQPASEATLVEVEPQTLDPQPEKKFSAHNKVRVVRGDFFGKKGIVMGYVGPWVEIKFPNRSKIETFVEPDLELVKN